MRKFSIGLAVALTAALIAGTAHANTVILECGTPDKNIPHAHALVEFDKSASTVREHMVDDDGVPYTMGGQPTGDFTYPAQISDSTITYTVPLAGGSSQRMLGRYSGNLTSNNVWTDSRGPKQQTNVFACLPWTSPQSQQRRF